MHVKKIIISVITISSLLISASPALAHVVVRPKEAGIGAFQTFTIGVPVEKDIPTTGLRLVIPKGLNHVTPNVKPGWEIEVKKEGAREEATVTEITWTGGTIPAGQRDEFLFSAQVPVKESTVVWKAYQIYEDGSEVSWDQDPKAEHHSSSEEDSSVGPYSETKVIDDLTDSKKPIESKTDSLAIPLSIAAVILSVSALYLQFRKKK